MAAHNHSVHLLQRGFFTSQGQNSQLQQNVQNSYIRELQDASESQADGYGGFDEVSKENKISEQRQTVNDYGRVSPSHLSLPQHLPNLLKMRSRSRYTNRGSKRRIDDQEGPPKKKKTLESLATKALPEMINHAQSFRYIGKGSSSLCMGHNSETFPVIDDCKYNDERVPACKDERGEPFVSESFLLYDEYMLNCAIEDEKVISAQIDEDERSSGTLYGRDSSPVFGENTSKAPKGCVETYDCSKLASNSTCGTAACVQEQMAITPNEYSNYLNTDDESIPFKQSEAQTVLSPELSSFSSDETKVLDYSSRLDVTDALRQKHLEGAFDETDYETALKKLTEEVEKGQEQVKFPKRYSSSDDYLSPKLRWNAPRSYDIKTKSLRPIYSSSPKGCSEPSSISLWPVKTSTTPISSLTSARPSSPETVPDTRDAFSVPEQRSLRSLSSDVDQSMKPFVRPPFPDPVPERTEIPGLSSEGPIFSHFRLGEAINHAAKTCTSQRMTSPLFELYLRVIASSREGPKQYFEFADLFKPHNPPYLKGIWLGWQSMPLWDSDGKCFLDDQGEPKICRVVGRMEKTPYGKWQICIVSAWEAGWEDIEHVKGIVCTKDT